MLKKDDVEFLPYNSKYISVQEDLLEKQILNSLATGKIQSREVEKYMVIERHNLYKGFKFGGRVLEIGALYGSVTDYLCSCSKEVVALDFKETRREVLLKKCEKYDNLSVQIGDSLKIFELGSFDYIVVHDVIGLIKKFYKSSSNSLLLFINDVYKILNNNGVLYIDFENSLGIKYFAGAVEEYSKKRYTSLEGFKNYNFINTYNKEEIELICKESVFNNFKFYYPFPNSYFPSEIHTDFSLKYLNFSTYATKYFENDYVEYDWTNVIKQQNGNSLKNLNNNFFVELSKESCQSLVYCDIKLNNSYNLYFIDKGVLKKKNSKNGISNISLECFSKRLDVVFYKRLKKSRLIFNENILNIFIEYFEELYNCIQHDYVEDEEVSFRDIYFDSKNHLSCGKITKKQFFNIVNSLISNFYFYLKEKEYIELKKMISNKYNIDVILDDFSNNICNIVNPIIEEADYFKYIDSNSKNNEIKTINKEKEIIVNSKLFSED